METLIGDKTKKDFYIHRTKSLHKKLANLQQLFILFQIKYKGGQATRVKMNNNESTFS